MSDGRLRELERRWRRTDDPADEAEYLREHRRIGALSPSMAELAAVCGHAAASLLTGIERSSPRTVDELKAAMWALRPWGKAVAVRAAVAVARAALEAWPGSGPAPLMAVRAAERWLLCPCRRCCVAAGAASERAWRAYKYEGLHAAAAAASHAAEAAGPWPAGWFVAEPDYPAGVAADAAEASAWWGEPVLAQDRWAAVGRELVPWALGQDDPVRRRTDLEASGNANARRAGPARG